MSRKIKNDLWMDRFIKKSIICNFPFFSVTNRFEKQRLFERAKCKRKGTLPLDSFTVIRGFLGGIFFYIFKRGWTQSGLEAAIVTH